MTESMKSKYGFQIDMACSDMENASTILGDLPLWHYISRPTKMAFHDLTNSPSSFTPSHIRNLLGLGLKFCPTSCYTTNSQKIKKLHWRDSPEA
eukprot:9770390-Ditylum_brightwellii.AAC.1